MKAIITVDVPEHQIGQEVLVHFKDTMCVKSVCIPLTESDDCVNRAELLKALDTWDKFGVDDTGHLFRLDNLSYPHYEPYIHYRDVIKAVKGMPSVQPKSKTGHWILDETDNSITCNKCGCLMWASDLCYGDAHYCPNCGTRMESEDKE